MIEKSLITALVIIQLNYGTALVTMSPKLAQVVPPNLPPLREDYIICFNKYWDIKEQIDVQIREQWNCTNGCYKEQECCISYQVWDSLKTVKMGDECSPGAVKMIQVFLPMALHRIRDRCEPDYEYGSKKCKDQEPNVGPFPLWHNTTTSAVNDVHFTTVKAE